MGSEENSRQFVLLAPNGRETIRFLCRIATAEFGEVCGDEQDIAFSCEVDIANRLGTSSTKKEASSEVSLSRANV